MPEGQPQAAQPANLPSHPKELTLFTGWMAPRSTPRTAGWPGMFWATADASRVTSCILRSFPAAH